VALLASLLIGGSLAQQVRAGQTTYKIQPNDTLSSIAQQYGTSVGSLVKTNHLANPNVIIAGHSLEIVTPSGTSTTMPSPAAATLSTSARLYRVQQGDSLWSISLQYGVAVRDLAALNSLASPYLILAGQQLLIPSVSPIVQLAQPASAIAPQPKPMVQPGASGAQPLPKQAPAIGGVIYTVQPGDNLTALSMRFNVSVEAIAGANQMSASALLIPGEQLAIPAVASPSVAVSVNASAGSVPALLPVQKGYYLVQPGDTLSAIGWRYGSSAAAIAAANHITTDAILSIGQRLIVPGGREPFVTKAEVESLLTSEALAAGVAPSLAKAVAWQESGWQMVTASDGGIGVMQIMPDSVRWVSASLLNYSINPYDTADNIRAGIAMLRYYLHVYPDVQHALAAYHQGMASVDNEGIRPSTRQYIANILALQKRFEG